ncbi:transmembrane protein, putative (macronuclear) [Tetrahymena thermophila SB210]|uniref:Transmembrane protein, putative n=1 Tax=Tetrahymena thermophila (strain SB210) TaxID=312017 RepID=Q24BX1_TETTS|nr:transmembrane protein, putative [Tetrahymena thermophila SB210]EAS05266.2 transmembrane protein, putative [Tetrahymena thermophila SB210]|eukprot:XP_001025511.2 transmembrane protein, putative [Tetrahymena thermophila SB210]
MQFNDSNKQIFDFLVIVFKNSYTLIFSSTFSVEVHNIRTNQLITHLPTPCSKQTQLKQDLNYLYVFCSFQINVFIKKTLQFSNFFKINQFIYSGLKDVQNLYQDIFALLLYKNIILVQINENQSQLLDFFSNLDSPMIYNIDFIYLDQQKYKTQSIKIQCYSHTNIFDIYYKIQDNNIKTNNVLLTYSQQENNFNNQENVLDTQYKVYLQGFNLTKYIIKMNLQNTDLVPLNLYYEIFTSKSILEYQFKLAENNDQKKGFANLNSNYFILSQFQNLNFQTISLKISSTQEDLTLNPFKNIQKIIFNDIDFTFYNQTSSLDISYLKTVLLDDIQIKDGILQRQSCAIRFSNVQNILIKNLTIQSMKIYNSSLFLFEDINNLEILNLNIINSSIDFSLFIFINCQFINIQNLNVRSTNIISGSLLSFLKCQYIQFTDLIFSSLFKQNIHDKIRFVKTEKHLQSQNLTTQILNFQGCQNVSLNNISFEKIQDLTLTQVSHYSYQDELQYYSSLFQIKNLTASQIKIQNDGITVNQIFSINSIQALLSNITLKDISSNTNLINFNAQKQGIIVNSQFQNINLFGGSIINVIDGQITLILSNFTFVNSSNSPCAINVQQANQVLIIETSFKNLRNQKFINEDQIDPQLSYQGGAIKIKDYQNFTMQFCLFFNCSALYSGGAVHVSQAQQPSFLNILDTHFLENTSQKGQGGAVYLSFVKGINIKKSNFESNSAIEQEGGAIYFEHCDLKQFSNSIFKSNQAYIGGSIYYTQTNSPFLKYQNFMKNNILFQNNTAQFYGKNIGSIPFWIGISQHPDNKFLKIVDQFHINSISSGNYLRSSIYLNFIDEENNPLNFTGMQDMDTNNEKSSFQLQLYAQNNSQIIIQQGFYAILNQTLGMFELNFQSVYKISQNQSIFLISNALDNQGTYLKVKLNLQFRDCEIGEIVQESNQFIQCIECPQGKYSLKQPDMQKKQQLQCNLCPQQAYFCQGKEIKIKDGFWRESNLTDNILACKLQSCSFDNSQNKNGCLQGYVGPICNSCDTKGEIWGEQYGFKNNQCFPCSSSKLQIIYFVIYLLCYFVYISYTQYKIRKTKILIYQLQVFKKIDLLVTSKLSSSSSSDLSILFKLFINYIQILSCTTELNFNIPQFFNITINIFGDPIKTSIKSLDCLTKTSDRYPIWVHRILVQLFNMVILQVLINLSLYLIQRNKYNKKEKAIKDLPQIIKMTSILTYLFFQPSFTKILIEGLFCIKINDQYYLISDYTQSCHQYYYFLYELAFVGPLMLIWCFLIPLRLFFKLRQFQLNQKSNIEESQNIKNILAYGVMYHGYKNKYLYWEIVKIFLKFILMVVIYINQSNQIKAAIIIIVLIAYTYLLQLVKPHKNIKLQNTEKIFMFNLMSIFALLQIIINDDTNNQTFALVSKIYIILLNLIVIRTLILNILDWHQIQINEIDSFLNKFKRLIFKIQQKFPNQLKFLKFKQVKIIRIHKLWKKVILVFRNKHFINGQQFTNSNIFHNQQNNISIDNKINHNNIFKPDQRTKDRQSKQQVEQEIQLQNVTQNQIKLKDHEKIMTTSQLTLCTENMHANQNLFKATTPQNLTFRTKEELVQSQTISSEASRLNLPQSFFETLSKNMNNNQIEKISKKKRVSLRLFSQS